MDTIVLCHGFPGFDRIGPVDYFKGVKTHLESTFRDIRVLTPDVSAFGTTKSRSEELALFLGRNTKSEKVHIIAHSAGGLDARKLVSKGGLGESGRVATITTVSTPHEGTRLAEIALGEFKPTLLEGWRLFSRFRELFSRVSAPATEETLLLIENLVKNPFRLLSTLKKFEEYYRMRSRSCSSTPWQKAHQD